ncbi:protein of unknown function [Syntrophus gentianae]|uniref:ATP adenylyltransferase (5',5'''-P-1,P-4-tetraphosphate phosphorylase II) n=1 Tax=Syntrophus gentianae TaxID=43775 RepID=A0A1H7Z735_9BACT|nr:DUF4922 domain-containing protein [Syntrophus gentianae]SEM54422.1 protein of unknown function [Syntrophus gentianae]
MERNPFSASRIFADFDPERDFEAGPRLPDLCGQLLSRQKGNWPKLKAGYDAVADSLFRTIDCGGFSVVLQFNPQRIVSSGARVDPASISARPCFLCPANLPEAQQGILYRRHFLVLCNPFPIFPQHYTISDLNHSPQSLEEHLDIFLLLARDLAPSLAVFYNGPRCGASAPDHLHFQACPAGSLPIEGQLDDGRPVLPVATYRSARISRVKDLGRAVLAIEVSDAADLIDAIKKILTVMKDNVFPDKEPMLNLHGSFHEGKWRVLLFPRRKGRPDLYDREEAERVLISPASVEMGGLLVAPVERDFRRLNPDLVRHIYREVSVDPALLDEWTDQLSRMGD